MDDNVKQLVRSAILEIIQGTVSEKNRFFGTFRATAQIGLRFGH